VQSQVRLNRVPEKVPEKVWEEVLKKVPETIRGGFVAESGLGGFGAARSEGSRRKFNRAPEKIREKVWEAWCRARSGSTGCRRRFRRRCGRLWCGEGPEKVWEGDLKNAWRRFRRSVGGFGAEPS